MGTKPLNNIQIALVYFIFTFSCDRDLCESVAGNRCHDITTIP